MTATSNFGTGVIAWWQNYYNTTGSALTSVPTDVDDIFETFRVNWTNNGNAQTYAFQWWLAGVTASGYEGSGYAGGYYANRYTATSVNNMTSYFSIEGSSARDVTGILKTCLNHGAGISLGISYATSDTTRAGHAITLWGIEEDVSTGYLTKIYVTDSDDGRDIVYDVNVRYDEHNGCYRLLNTRFYNDLLEGITILSAYNKTDTTAPAARATGLNAQVQGSKITLRWNAVEDASGVIYEVYTGQGWTTTTDNWLEFTSLSTGYHDWGVRVFDGAGNEGAYSDSSYTCSVAAPTLNVGAVTTEKVQDGQAQCTFVWYCTTNATYTLSLNGEEVYSGTAKTWTTTLEDGEYAFTVTATNANGGTITRSGDNFRVDTQPPATPSGLKVSREGNMAVFSWDAVEDRSAITYVFYCYGPSGMETVYEYGLTETRYTMTLPQEATYHWSVRAYDGTHYSDWVNGDPLYHDLTAPVLKLNDLNPTYYSKGESRVYFSWESDERTTSVLVVDGVEVYSNTSSYFYHTHTLYLADGNHSYTITATDKAGNTSTLTGTLLCDTVAPEAPGKLLHKLSEDGKSVTLSWKGSNENGSHFEIRLTGPEGSQNNTIDAGNTCTISLAKEGNYTWAVKEVDAAGNASSWSSTSSFNNDVTPPQPTLNTPVLQKTAEGQTRVTFSWSCNEAATYELYLNNRRIYSGTAENYTTTVADGSHSYSIKATDLTNKATTVSGFFECDATAPALPGGISVSMHEGTATLSWQGEAGAVYEIEYRPAGSTSCTTDTTTLTSYTLALPAEGEYEWRLRATDAAGNTSNWAEGPNIVYDLTAPTLRLRKPTFTPAGKGELKATLSWFCDEDATYELLLDGRSVYTGTQNSHKVTVQDGAHTYTLIATDASGNRAEQSDSFRCDTTPPVLSDLNTSLSNEGNGQTGVAFNWQSNEEAIYTLKVDGWLVYEGREAATSLLLGDGKHTYELSAQDDYGNESNVLRGSFVSDTTAPTLPTSLKTKLKSKGARVTLSWKGSKDKNKVSYEVAYKEASADDYISIGELRKASLTLTLDEITTYHWGVRATDALGNSTEWVWADSFSNDLAAPVLSGLSTEQQKVGNGQANVSFSWQSNETATYTLKIDGKLVHSGSESTLSLVLGDGKHKYELIACDAAGNRSKKLKGKFTTDTSAPTNPAAFKVKVKSKGTKVTLSWKKSKDKNKLTYELAYKEAGASDYTCITGLRKTSTTLSLPTISDYHWGVRATDALGNSTEWVWADTFSNDIVAPVLSAMGTEQQKEDNGRTNISFSWQSNEEASYELRVDGQLIYTGSNIGTTCVLGDGKHKYELIAYDAAGNKSKKLKGKFTTDATAPTSPHTLRTKAKGSQVTFSWKAGKDKNKITYTLAYKETSASEYSYIYDIKKTSTKLTLAPEATYSWGVCATDSFGNSTEWVWGTSIGGEATHAAPALAGLDRELGLSAGLSCPPQVNTSAPATLAACSLDQGLAALDKQTTLAQGMLA